MILNAQDFICSPSPQNWPGPVYHANTNREVFIDVQTNNPRAAYWFSCNIDEQ